MAVVLNIKGRSMFLARNVIFSLLCKTIFNFGCYPSLFSFNILLPEFATKDQKTLPYIHLAYYSRSFRSLSVCWVLNKRAPLPNFVFFPAQNWPANWSDTNFNYFPSTFVEKEKENLSDNGDQFTWNLSIVYRST